MDTFLSSSLIISAIKLDVSFKNEMDQMKV